MGWDGVVGYYGKSSLQVYFGFILTRVKGRSLLSHCCAIPQASRSNFLYLGHVNNVNYVRYAETGRVNWTHNFGLYIDPAHKKEWMSLVGSTGIGLILKSMKVDYKFVSVVIGFLRSRGHISVPLASGPRETL
jgi:hypothetical protein